MMIWILIANAQAASLSDLVAGDLIISELHTSPAATTTTRGQWFELYNASGDAVDLDGLIVSDGGSQAFTVSGTLTVADGDRVVFATRAASALNGGLPVVDYVYSTTDYSLPAGNAQLDVSYDGVTFDSVSFGAGFPDEHGASMSLAPGSLDATDNDTGSNWCPAAATFGDGDYGSPGAANDDCPIDLSSLISGDLVITEVMHTPAAVSYNRGEWIEVYNASGAYIDLDGLLIDSSLDSMTLSGETLMRPGDYAIIAARANPVVNGGLPDVDYRYIYGTELRLLTTDSLSLSYGLTTLDDVSWNPTDYDGGSGIAEQLNSSLTTATDNDDSASWCAASSAYGDGDYGSPGEENSDCDLDTDGDGYDEDVDCDDNDAGVNPGAAEVCDGIDNDCSGLIDDSPTDGSTFYADADGDFYGDPGSSVDACERPGGYRTNALDCDDTDGSISPSAVEVCDGDDNDCDGNVDVDAADASAWYPDGDGDGYGDAASPVMDCAQPSGTIADGTDCDDADAAINPAASETCDGTDDNCSGDENDASDTTTWYADLDYDFYGDPGNTFDACTRPSGFRSNDADCDDTDDAINPGAEETCDGTDDNCSGDESDASDATAWYPDGDSDGYGDAASPVMDCSQPSGTIADGTDCDDSNAAINPAAAETCDGIDSNCSGDESDASDVTTFYADLDYDFYGDPGSTVDACERPSGYRTNDADCDDTDDAINPGEEETCNDGIDNDCDGEDYRTCDATLGESADGQITGESAGDAFGGSVAAVGDLDGDSSADFAVTGGEDTVYIFDGASSWVGDSSAADAPVTLTGGGVVSGGHDIDGDGYDDVLVGSSTLATNGTDAGGAYVAYGPLSGDIDLTIAADATLLGDDAGDGAGSRAVLIGDVDADGYADMLIAATGDDESGDQSGAAYLILGPTTGGDLSAAAYATFTGDSTMDYLGRGAAAVGDVDGDGSPDVMVNAYREDRTVDETTTLNVGATYLLTDFSSGTQDIAEAATATVFGENALDQTGSVISGAGDVDGDGYDDVLIASWYADPGALTDSGEAYLMLGPISGDVSVTAAQARFPGVAAGDAAGRSVAGLGDINDDGHGDIVVGAKLADEGATDAGAAYIMLGPVSGSINLSLADAILSGDAAGDRAGFSVASIEDQDGGGQADLLVGATLNDDGGDGAGAAYLIFTERW